MSYVSPSGSFLSPPPTSSALQADLWGPHRQALGLSLPVSLGHRELGRKEGREGGQSIYFSLTPSTRESLGGPCPS